MSVEELLEKYKGAYASDFEVPSASGSKASSDVEVSGDEEEETEEDESDAESNTSSSGIVWFKVDTVEPMLDLYNEITSCSQTLRETVLKKKTVRRTLKRVRKKMRMMTVEMKVQNSC